MTVKIHGTAYATVNERLLQAHGEGLRPKGIRSICTGLESFGAVLVCHAVVTFEDGREFHGHSEVPANSTSPAERDAPVECAETSAVGRALAMAGYFGSEAGLAGAEEVSRPPRGQVTTPAAPADGGSWPGHEGSGDAAPRRIPPTATATPATEKQVAAIRSLSAKTGKAVDVAGLSREQASELITRLSDELYQGKQGQAQ